MGLAKVKKVSGLLINQRQKRRRLGAFGVFGSDEEKSYFCATVDCGLIWKFR